MEIAGYIVTMLEKNGVNCRPMGYGEPGEICAEMLLAGRPATLFPSTAAAMAALEESGKNALAEGDLWPEKFQFRVITVQKNG